MAGGGGGATHISLATGLLSSTAVRDNILLVAGGGGGNGANNGTDSSLNAGGAGGGTSGIAGLSGTNWAGQGGTQTTGGATGTDRGNIAGVGTLGQGGSCTTAQTGGGGGGGWFGGGSGSWEGGGGGSGHIHATRITDGTTLSGNQSMPNPNGGNMTGREGGGFARITPLSTISVQFGTNSANQCTNVVIVNSTTITCTVPPHSAGTVDVIVTINGQSQTLPQSYTYIHALEFTSITPTSGIATGGTLVTLTGNNLGLQNLSNLAVTFDPTGTPSQCVSIQVVNNNTITCTTTAHTGGLVDVRITNGIETVTLSDAFTYIPVTISISSATQNVNIDLMPGNPVNCTANPRIGCAQNNVTVTTNNPTGFTLRLSMQTNDQPLRRDGNSLTHMINPIPTTVIGENEWGFSLNSGTSWLAVPPMSNPAVIRTTTVATPTTGETTPVFFGARVNHTIPAGQYSGHVTFTAVAN